MLPLRYARRWRMASLIILLFVLATMMMPAVWFWDDRLKALSWLDSFDKWLHGIIFLLLTLWFSGLYRRRSYWKIGTGLLLFGLIIEVCQRMVSYRTGDWIDWAADTGGIILGLVIALTGIGGWCLRAEDRLGKRQH